MNATCTECGEPCRSPHALVCSDRCRTRRHRGGRAQPKALYLAELRARRPTQRPTTRRRPPSLRQLEARIAALEAHLETHRKGYRP